MRRVLKDESLETQFQKDGYVCVPFISAKEVEELKQLFFDTLPESGGQITSDDIKNEHFISYDFTFIDKNPEYKRKVYEIISSYFKPHMERLLDNYKPIIANYIRKKPETGEVPLHQNWAFSDEMKCSTVSIWCPLVDSTVENGTLQVVPGSHKKFGKNRGPMVPWELENIKNEIIDHFLIPLETKAGDCVILDDSIIHYSAINKTEGLRLTMQLICIPSEMPSLHYHKNPQGNGNIEVLEVDENFYFQFNPWKFPTDVKKVGEIPFKGNYLSINDFQEVLKRPRFDTIKVSEEKGLFTKIFGLFRS
jgi:hypothetical protein